MVKQADNDQAEDEQGQAPQHEGHRADVMVSRR